ncbi:hypothetical protein FHR81_003262 [Actinoalloteichus hoggarensis]|uniref:Uncharacterized protein n=1 Tax=Actinoalloteichus hoggarensis TaxID=1470176 RepID=A0A221W6U9_9PSEU|nr:hypothetical protein [Actinoalloteichus hoggarensis]ASO21618.1 hypothetical protein AHOG_20000 [Actinoalloteichus hoggarensis]MBB5922210.1 hypothetical protein [Actinoalloteichus hoggarensis]
MSSPHSFPDRRGGYSSAAMPLDTARTAFDMLLTGPHPLAVDGRLFPGFPDRRVPLNEVRDRLLARRCPQSVRDSVWAHLVLLARTDGAAWTVGCVGVGLPALLGIASRLSARFAGDPADIHAAVLTGFLAELPRVDLRRPRVMLRLRWAAYRAGHAAVREALDAPQPTGHAVRAAAPVPPWGHPDFVLARAVADKLITAADAELIAATRLEGRPLAAVVAERDASYATVHQARRRAERRLAAYLLQDADDADDGGDPARRVADTLTVTTAATTPDPSPSVTRPRCGSSEKTGALRSKRRRDSGVQVHGRSSTSPESSSLSSSTPEVPRCV